MEKCCEGVLWRSVVEKCCREWVVEKCCEGELWRIVVVKFCGEVLR